MIRGVDGQVMTQRAAEYSKDVSVMLRRDEVANEFADRINRLNVQQETQTVTQPEKAAHGRINRDEERDRGQKNGKGGKRRGKQGGNPGGYFTRHDDLPSVGAGKDKLLDIEV